MGTHDFIGPNYVSEGMAWFWVVAVTLVFGVPALLVWYRGMRERRAERAARGELDSVGALAPGPRVLVVGAIELARGATRAVRVELVAQAKEQRGKNTTTHEWKERERVYHAEPFYIRQRGGARVRVEPGPGDPFLIDTLAPEGEIRDYVLGAGGLASAVQTFVAELIPGERLVAVGRLERGEDPEADATAYRGSRTGWVMRAPDSAPLRLMSRSILTLRAKERRFLQRSLQVLAGVLVLAHLPFATFYLRAVSGEAKLAHVSRSYVSHGRDRHGNSTTTTYVSAHCRDGRCHIDAPSGVYVREGRRIWLTVGPTGTIFGRSNSWNALWLIGHAFAALFVWIATVAILYQKQWWEMKRFSLPASGPIPWPPNLPEPSPTDAVDEVVDLESRGKRR